MTTNLKDYTLNLIEELDSKNTNFTKIYIAYKLIQYLNNSDPSNVLNSFDEIVEIIYEQYLNNDELDSFDLLIFNYMKNK